MAHITCFKSNGSTSASTTMHLGVGVAGDVVEVDRWISFAQSSCGAGCGSQIRFQLDGLGDPQQLSLLLEH